MSLQDHIVSEMTAICGSSTNEGLGAWRRKQKPALKLVRCILGVRCCACRAVIQRGWQDVDFSNSRGRLQKGVHENHKKKEKQEAVKRGRTRIGIGNLTNRAENFKLKKEAFLHFPLQAPGAMLLERPRLLRFGALMGHSGRPCCFESQNITMWRPCRHQKTHKPAKCGILPVCCLLDL
jgi:hypothetical protein